MTAARRRGCCARADCVRRSDLARVGLTGRHSGNRDRRGGRARVRSGLGHTTVARRTRRGLAREGAAAIARRYCVGHDQRSRRRRRRAGLRHNGSGRARHGRFRERESQKDLIARHRRVAGREAELAIGVARQPVLRIGLVRGQAVEQRLRALTLEWNERAIRVTGRKSRYCRFASAKTGDGEVPRSQLTTGDHPGIDDALPSHCSAYTSVPGVKPVALMLKAIGFLRASPGTLNGFVFGVVIVDAPATPALSATSGTAVATTTTTNRLSQLLTRLVTARSSCSVDRPARSGPAGMAL